MARDLWLHKGSTARLLLPLRQVFWCEAISPQDPTLSFWLLECIYRWLSWFGHGELVLTCPRCADLVCVKEQSFCGGNPLAVLTLRFQSPVGFLSSLLWTRMFHTGNKLYVDPQESPREVRIYNYENGNQEKSFLRAWWNCRSLIEITW